MVQALPIDSWYAFHVLPEASIRSAMLVAVESQEAEGSQSLVALGND
jgi:hypothetical protein